MSYLSSTGRFVIEQCRCGDLHTDKISRFSDEPVCQRCYNQDEAFMARQEREIQERDIQLQRMEACEDILEELDKGYWRDQLDPQL